MKETNRLKTCLELSFDSKQIFLIFFASAVVISLVFALGVMVGKRLDRGVVKNKATDPLALLDQMGQENLDDDLTFQDTLTTNHKKGAGPNAQEKLLPEEKLIEPNNNTANAASANDEPAEEPKENIKNEAKEKDTAHSSLSLVNSIKPATKIPLVKEKTASEKTGKVKHELVDKQVLSTEGNEKKKKVSLNDIPNKSEKSTKETNGSYTLQLSSFQEKGEAETFMKKLREAGLKPYLISANIPGRGVWFRVRIGKYKTWDEALAAKQEFEKKQNFIAYVSKN